jgi:ABC-type phosphate transport system permease subunit
MTEMMDRQTKFAFATLAVLIAFIVLLYFFGNFSGWYEVD